MQLKGSKTHDNLKAAFAANRRPTAATSTSREGRRGRPERRRGAVPLDREGETGHAHGHLEYMEPVGDPATDLPIGRTKLNLSAAVAGETHEYTDMYPGMAKTARSEGLHRDRRLVRDAGQGGALARQPLPEGARSASGVMPQIAPDSLLSLEAYARERSAYRSRVIAHKKLRTVHAGEHVTLIFEDEQTIRYQVQEMLRIERIFEEDGIRGDSRPTTR
jgi:rubrerythrin